MAATFLGMYFGYKARNPVPAADRCLDRILCLPTPMGAGMKGIRPCKHVAIVLGNLCLILRADTLNAELEAILRRRDGNHHLLKYAQPPCLCSCTPVTHMFHSCDAVCPDHAMSSASHTALVNASHPTVPTHEVVLCNPFHYHYHWWFWSGSSIHKPVFCRDNFLAHACLQRHCTCNSLCLGQSCITTSGRRWIQCRAHSFVCRQLPDRSGLPGRIDTPGYEKQKQSTATEDASTHTVTAGTFVQPVHCPWP